MKHNFPSRSASKDGAESDSTSPAPNSTSVTNDGPARLSRGKPKEREEIADESVPVQQTEKIFFLPTMNEKTFIDHGCTLDAEGYPLLPNGNTVYVKPAGVAITNFGEVGFSKRMGTEYQAKGTWKLKRIYCLGVICCDLPECRWAGTPPTGKISMEDYLAKNSPCRGSAGRCPGHVQHIKCNTTLIRVDEHLPTSWAILRHSGTHNHVWPEAKKPDKLAPEALRKEVANNPKAGALSLKLFLFIQVLEEDFDAVMQGVSIKYGAAQKGQNDVSLLLGWEKKRKRALDPAKHPTTHNTRHEFFNDGRAPETTNTLLPELAGKKKLGRPSGSANVDRNPFSTYVSYHASTKAHLSNRCWMSASLKSLAQTSLFQQAQIRSPGSFNPGAFASANLFIELILDPIQNGNLVLEGLFEVEEKRDLSCSRHPDAPQQEKRRVYIINIRRSAFNDNHVPHSDVSELLKKWFSSGLHVQSAITCRVCQAGGAEIIRLAEHSILKFPKGQAPPHLHFSLDVAAIVKPSEQKDFMGATN
ncbi:hypothetical protein PCASD_10085 [Puccinia coronata f. sp. avenae]|uniref:GCM domain-containing protein n=1 Tax=Puccinia coronata f. sp. avenae TaxID=200324 RepID=A0A2N5UW90_9BASI|nr:hypothetical protein PCASD_10085 [Puccinia coronata f. sp. avenae]